MLERLATTRHIMDTGAAAFARGIPEIYTAADAVDRAEAESMLRTLLATYGITRCQFAWDRPRFLITPPKSDVVRAACTTARHHRAAAWHSTL